MKKIHKLVKEIRAKDPKAKVAFNLDNSAIVTARGKLTIAISPDKLLAAPHEQARKFISGHTSLLGAVSHKDLVDSRHRSDPHGRLHVVFNQKHGSAEVLGGTLSVHYDEKGVLYLLKSNLKEKIDAPKKPKVKADKAVAAAIKHAGRGTKAAKMFDPELLVVDAETVHSPKASPSHYLCWKVVILQPDGSRRPDWVYFINAQDSTPLFRYSADQTGTGDGHYSTGVALSSEPSGADFRLRDDDLSAAWPGAAKPVIHTYDDNGSISTFLNNYSLDSDDDWDNEGSIPALRKDDQRPEVDLHRFLGYVVDYYHATHNYNGWDGSGRDARGHVHNEKYSNNAFWSPSAQEIFFADGNGTTRDFMCPLDTVAHEYTHGVCFYLDIVQTYSGETGALNEANADLFGALVALNHPGSDPWPWHHGRQYRLDGGLGRNMITPAQDGAGVVQYDDTSNATKAASCRDGFYPDHYSIRYTGASDYFGVHWNAPIITHCVYLMINGGTNRVSGITVTGIGVGPVEQMLWEVDSTGLLTNTSQFADYRLAFIEACQTLFPENLDYLATVKSAFRAVGIGPDLYIRDRLTDQGEEPGTSSCMSPDIIVRRNSADAATLTQIGDPNNGSLCEEIELGSGDHHVYFRIFNRGANSASGTFRLFISPNATFSSPASWTEVGHYDFSGVAAHGGLWVPTAADECITLSAATISALGTGHFCFIGIIESNSDPAPDRLQISNISEFHDFIAKSNNFAWRNCNIVDLLPDESGEIEPLEFTFQLNNIPHLQLQRELELDTGELPPGTAMTLWLEKKFQGIKMKDVFLDDIPYPRKVTDLVRPGFRPKGILRPMEIRHPGKLEKPPKMLKKHKVLSKLGKFRPMVIPPGKLLRLDGMNIKRGETMYICCKLTLPKGVGPRDITLPFRELIDNKPIGQMNYQFRIRKAR